MERLDPVIAELETARSSAVAHFAAEANMPVGDFLRHFQVILEEAEGETKQVSFRVEPRE